MFITHPLAPIWDASSRVLVLGTMPSPRSRAANFYYAHPQNRFWPVLAKVLHTDIPATTAERTAFLLTHHIALWDVLASCEIEGASDASIRHATPNDIGCILAGAPIQAVFTTGKAAEKWYQRLLAADMPLQAIALPSPSPANCAVPFEKLVQAYSIIKEYL